MEAPQARNGVGAERARRSPGPCQKARALKERQNISVALSVLDGDCSDPGAVLASLALALATLRLRPGIPARLLFAPAALGTLYSRLRRLATL